MAEITPSENQSTEDSLMYYRSLVSNASKEQLDHAQKFLSAAENVMQFLEDQGITDPRDKLGVVGAMFNAANLDQEHDPRSMGRQQPRLKLEGEEESLQSVFAWESSMNAEPDGPIRRFYAALEGMKNPQTVGLPYGGVSLVEATVNKLALPKSAETSQSPRLVTASLRGFT